MQRRERRQKDGGRRVFHVRFEGGEDLPILFANHIFVRSSSDGFLVSFAQSHGPYVVKPSPKDIEREGIAAKVICRLLIPHSRIHDIARIFQEQAANVRIVKKELSGDKPPKR